MVLLNPLFQYSFSFPDVMEIAFGTLDVVYHSSLVFFFHFFLQMHQVASHGVVGSEMDLNPGFSYDVGYGIRHCCQLTVE